MEPQALAHLFDAHAASLVLYARQWVSAPLAEDLVQEAFIQLAAQVEAPGNGRAWLLVAVRNRAIDALRTRRRHEARGKQLKEQWMFARPEPSADPLDVEEAQRALMALPADQREVITLRLWNDATFEEIAALTGMPLSTVYLRYKSGLEQIRARWESPCRER